MDQFFRSITANAGATFPTLTDLLGRWKADEGVTTSGGNVTQVNDLSGRSQTLTNNGTVPFNASSAYNGRPAFDFIAANDACLRRSSFDVSIVTTSPALMSVFFVGRMLTATAQNGGAISMGPPGGETSDWDSPVAAAHITRNSTTNAVISVRNSLATGSPAISLNTNYRIGVIWGATSGQMYINNVATGAALSISNDFDDPIYLVIGNRLTGGPPATITGHAWEGPICEIVITGSELTTTERNNLDTYFTAQWGS